MRPLSTRTFIFKRLADDWKLLLSAFLGIVVATGLIAGAPVYVRALERQSLNTAIERSSNLFLNLFVASPYIPLDKGSLETTELGLEDSVRRHVPELQRGRQRYLKTPTHLVGLPSRPLPDSPGGQVSRGYFQFLSNLEHHVEFLEGRMATDAVSSGPQGPVIEAVVGSELAAGFKLKEKDVVTLTPSLGDPTRITVVIVGIVEPTDVSEEYWGYSHSIFMEPAPLDEEVDPEVLADPEEPPLALFVTQEALTQGVGKAYPGTLVHSSWFIFVDKEPLKGWSISESRSRLEALQNELSASMQGSTVITGIGGLMDDFERRSFFASVPLLLLLTIMVITVLYYLAMMVSYLVQSRETDVALLRSRGVSTLQLLRLYALEGLVLTVVAVVLAPFLAMGVVAVAGKLPYFREITGGDMLPVEFHWVPFLAAAAAGLLSLAIFVIPGVVGARTGLVIHKLRSSRPPSVPFYHRYYLDIGLLVVGGLIFWELYDRGQFVSGGLFKDVEVNEALLLAPVLFLTVVALLFLRFFPLFVRFISGESPALVHLVVAATLISLAPAIAVQGVEDGDGLGWLVPVVLLGGLAGAYWLTYRSPRLRLRLLGLALQTGLVAAVVAMEPPVAGEVSFIPTISLISMVPAQVMFHLFRVSAQVAPVWVSMGMWHMARNPLQYSWLVLLLVMVTGLGVLATTVGGTLDRSHEERVLYDVGADIRVRGVQSVSLRGNRDLKERYLSIPGVTAVSMAHRGKGIVGTTLRGNRFEFLAMESQDFPYISWYRDDFSVLPLTGVMRALQPSLRPEPLEIPEGATTIGVWAKPEDSYKSLFLWMVIQDARGFVVPVSMGSLEEPGWRQMKGEIHPALKQPLQLVSVQIFEPGFGASGTPGSLLLDDIHVTIGSQDNEHKLEDFEDRIRWDVVPTSSLSSDSLALTREDAYRGDWAALFSFGKETNGGIRGFYLSPSGGPLPIVASSSFMAATGAQVGDQLIVKATASLISVVIRGTVDYFPTMTPTDRGFMLADLEALLGHVNIMTLLNQVTPNELFISEAPGAGEAVRDVVLQIVRNPNLVHDKDAQLASFRLDPLITAGWRAMVVLSLGIIVFTAGLGYITYLLSYAYRSRSEMGFLQSLGLSRRQMMGLLGLEQLVIVMIGLGLGTWAGFQMSRLMVSSVSITETGQRVVPPFILTTDWTFMAAIFVALLAIFSAALYRLTRGMLHLDLHTISRVEGQ